MVVSVRHSISQDPFPTFPEISCGTRIQRGKKNEAKKQIGEADC